MPELPRALLRNTSRVLLAPITPIPGAPGNWRALILPVSNRYRLS